MPAFPARRSSPSRGSRRPEVAEEATEPGTTGRRGLLIGLGAAVAGSAIVAGSLGTGESASAAPAGDGVQVAETVLELTRRRAGDGDVVAVLGYHAPGDVRGLVYRGIRRDGPAANGGTVIAGSHGSRWMLQHDGVIAFHHFGVLDAATPADDALDALVGDPSVHRIEAHTPVNFVRRHVFTRSNLELDFGGHLVTTEGIEANSHDNPFGAVMFFTGTPANATIDYALDEPFAELTDAVRVPDAAAFPVDSWWTLSSDEVSGSDERELQRFVRITQQVDATHVRIDYLNGWTIDAGRRLRWRSVEPVERVRIRNMRFLGAGPYTGPTDGSFPDPRELSGSHPVAFEYAVHCDVSDIHASRTWWPVIMRRWNTSYITERCSLVNPPTVFYGGAGYLTQQIACLYGHVRDCASSNARHLNDFTASAHSMVENCHGDGDDQGGNPFTTHGQYEHDLVFQGCSGLMDIANSGAQWGTSAKRITVRDHVCSWFVAGTKITDLTLENVRVVPRSTFDQSATLTVNADGAQVRGCSAGLLAIGQRSSRSTRPTVIEDCSFALPKDQVLVQTPVANTVHFVRTTITGIDGTQARGSGRLEFVDCALESPEGAAPFGIGSATLVIRGGTLRGVGIEASAVRDQSVVLAGVHAEASRPDGAVVSRGEGPGVVSLELDGGEYVAGTPDTALLRMVRGENHVRITGTRFRGGRLDVADGGGASPSTLLVNGTVEQGVTRSLPDESDRFVYGPGIVR
ncbi:hypothetical protein ABIC29_002794 [Agromyces sp. PvR057]